MAKDDLRYRRTERNLMKAFDQALAETPLERITVTSLARAAEINKSTFYLHYQDVFELARAYTRMLAAQTAQRMDEAGVFLTQPKEFARWFVDDFAAHTDLGDRLGRNHLMQLFAHGLMEELRARFEGTYDYPDEPGKDIALTFAVSGMLETLPSYSETHRDELVKVLGELLDVLGMGAGAARTRRGQEDS